MVSMIWVAALVAACCTGTALATASSSRSGAAIASNLSGKWKGHYSGAYSGKFTIRWTQTGRKLKGTLTLSKPKGTVDNSNAITYHGSWSGTTMSGVYQAGGRSGSWSAHKVS